MPIMMKKIYNFKGNYTKEEKEGYITCIELFRTQVGDLWKEKNLFDKKQYHYTDDDIVKFLNLAVRDINGGVPPTDYTIDRIMEYDESFIIDGAVIFSLMAEGLLNVRNNVNYNDSGLSIAMFDKGPSYQSWMGMLYQQYTAEKAAFKSTIIPQSANSGFMGINSQFGYYW